MQRLLLPLSFCLMLLLSACDKYKDYTSATVIDTGNITSAGCGYLLQIGDGTLIKPVYLPSAFQHANIKVLVKYSISGRSNCNPQTGYDMAEIDDIVRDL